MNNKNSTICTGCTLLCDDTALEFSGNELRSNTDCLVAKQWLEKINQSRAEIAQDAGRVNSLAAAISQKLHIADAPLIVGLNHLTTEAQQSAWKIADLVGASIDVTLSKSNRASIYALQRQGKVTASLGEITNRSDLVVFWFCDPMKTHPRLIQRLTQTRSATKKQIIVVGDAGSETAQVADRVFSVSSQSAHGFIESLRLMISRHGTRGTAPIQRSEQAQQLAALLTSSRYGSWIYGHTAHVAELDHVTRASQALVRELNDHTRFVSLGLRADQNASSGENVLAAFSGFPAAVNLAMGFPRYNGPQFAAETLLENGDVDFVLLFAGWGTSVELQSLTPAAKSFLTNVPKAVVTSDSNFNLPAEFRLEIEVPGVGEAGEFCRVDDVSMGVAQIATRTRPTAFEFLRSMQSLDCYH